MMCILAGLLCVRMLCLFHNLKEFWLQSQCTLVSYMTLTWGKPRSVQDRIFDANIKDLLHLLWVARFLIQSPGVWLYTQDLTSRPHFPSVPCRALWWLSWLIFAKGLGPSMEEIRARFQSPFKNSSLHLLMPSPVPSKTWSSCHTDLLLVLVTGRNFILFVALINNAVSLICFLYPAIRVAP